MFTFFRNTKINIILTVIIELFIVFLGVYTAFMLDDYKSQKQKEKKKMQIYTHFFNIAEQSENEINIIASAIDSSVNKFMEKYNEGNMPIIEGSHNFFTTSVNDRIWKGILNNGGIELLDFNAITIIDNYHNSQIYLLKTMETAQDFSRDLVYPNIDKGNDYFYNLKTKKLKKKFSWYISYLTSLQWQIKQLQLENKRLLKKLGEKIKK